MSKRALTVQGLPHPGGAYSHIVQAGGLVYTAGFGPRNPLSGEIADGIVSQTEQAIDNLQCALESVGASLRDLVKTTVHLSCLQRDFAPFDDAYKRRMPEPFPVRTTVGSGLSAGFLVEIDGIAILPATAAP